MSAEGFLEARLFLRTVFWQDAPLLEVVCPSHPIFNTMVFRDYHEDWMRWREMQLTFVRDMEHTERSFLNPPMPLHSGASGMSLRTSLRWIQEQRSYVERMYAPQASQPQVIPVCNWCHRGYFLLVASTVYLWLTKNLSNYAMFDALSLTIHN